MRTVPPRLSYTPHVVRILVVDDSPDSRALIHLALREAGYADLQFADSAAGAFAALEMDAPVTTRPAVDLVLMDVQMPGMDGLEACRRIQAVVRLRDVPLIVVTAETEDETLQAAFAAGAVDYITKPLRTPELVARTRSALRLKEEMDWRKDREAQLLGLARELERANQELRRLSFLDGLTGISNRRGFDDYVAREWSRAARAGTSLSLILVDVDHFKAYNDRYGHLAGDDCLKQVAGALADRLRRPTDLVARYGGEEFAVVLPGADTMEAAFVAEALRTGVEALDLRHEGSSTSDRVTISLGVASRVPSSDEAPQELLDAADQALYSAKRRGRNLSLPAPPPDRPAP
jgi:diguanylate cyclase (GGDEF)-like protein